MSMSNPTKLAAAYDIIVTLNGVTHTPTIVVQPSGSWRITGHEALKAALTHEEWLGWLADFWAAFPPKVTAVAA